MSFYHEIISVEHYGSISNGADTNEFGSQKMTC